MPPDTDTLTAQDLWTAYRGEGEQTNHDGSFRLPESIDDLGPEQRDRWHQVLAAVNQSQNIAIGKAGAAHSEHAEELGRQLRAAQAEGDGLRSMVSDIERASDSLRDQVAEANERIRVLQDEYRKATGRNLTHGWC